MIKPKERKEGKKNAILNYGFKRDVCIIFLCIFNQLKDIKVTKMCSLLAREYLPKV